MKNNIFACFTIVAVVCSSSFLSGCNKKSNSPTRVLNQTTLEATSYESVISDFLAIINVDESGCFFFSSSNQENKNIESDTFKNKICLITTEQEIKNIDQNSASINNWMNPLYSTEKFTLWKNVITFGEESETIWENDNKSNRKDLYSVLPNSFLMDSMNKMMFFQEKKEEFIILNFNDIANPIEYKIQNKFSFISTNKDNQKDYRLSSFHAFKSGYLLIVSNYYYYSNNPYRYIFFPQKGSNIGEGIELLIPETDKYIWHPADFNYESDTFAMLDHTQIISYYESKETPNSPEFIVENAEESNLLLFDLQNPSNPLIFKSKVELASCVKLIDHPEGVQLFVFPRNFQNNPIKTPIWIKTTNSIREQNPLYITLNGVISDQNSIEFKIYDPLTWVLFVNEKTTSNSGWLVKCTASEKDLTIQDLYIETKEQSIITCVTCKQGEFFYTTASRELNRDNTEKMSLNFISIK
ncbi:MAG: hypothetical protein KAH01_04710 [Caldisericia bacterium]|nr:hypothetical protein [Caldisericia bacterium]